MVDTDLPLSSRAILFIHLSDSISNSNKTSSQFKLLKRIINESSDTKDDLDRSLNKIIYAYSYAIANGKILGASAVNSLTSNNSFAQLKNELFNLAFNGKNYKFFLAFVIAACLMICFIVSSLCLTFYFYKQRQAKNKFPTSSNKKRATNNAAEIYNYATVNKEKNNIGEFERLNAGLEKSNRTSSNSSGSSAASTSSSTSLTKTTNSTAASAQLITTNSNRSPNLVVSSVSSVSPASTNNSSESNQKFYTTNYETLQMNYSSIDSSSNANTLDRPLQLRNNGNNNMKGNTFMYGDEPNYSSVFKVFY